MNIEKAKEEIQQLADRLKAELDAPEEFPQINGWYWTIDSMKGGISKARRMDNFLYFFRKSIGWVWRTEVEAQRHFNKLKAEERVRQYIAKANGDWVADFSNPIQLKATWGYDHAGDLYSSTASACQTKDACFYINPKLFDQLIEDCGSDIKRILGVE